MQVRTLSSNDKDHLLQALNHAFADYIVPFQLTAEQLQSKIKNEDIHLPWSVGAFDNDKLIAFMLYGVRENDGNKTVYNGGTGVLPAYRGKGLVGQMSAFMKPFFQENNVQQVVLEVIEGNDAAIRAYEKDGFTINRKLLCFSGEIQVKSTDNIATIQTINEFSWPTLQSFWDITPSWQNMPASIEHMHLHILGAFVQDQLIGYVFFSPLTRRIHQFAVAPLFRRKGIASRLFAEINRLVAGEKVQVNNVDEASFESKLFLEKLGLTNHIDQFEMITGL
ncbi:GNAT family N-acetyltransferase [Sphingobacterium psychroaquaticum]|uniref:GNAT family N-acetyltransferase n=1 Tax=Sphingobacterium psychroaquaticum TaxID=561061 RepID=UPI00106D3E73|nr:GNAT family N-acetyltransferase [Sphingobacterium psychroaquaticum]QBQ41723.1 GNAT family N-acetyltransferase [Sphingobacterium psychroaquaticum]